MKVKNILDVLTFNNYVSIFENGDGCEFFDGPKELVPDLLHQREIKYMYVFDNSLQICVL